MINYNSLLIEAHTLPQNAKNDTAVYTSFLDTMAKFHRYPVATQINLHYHAPAGARAVASADLWHRGFATALVEGATAIPVLLPNKNAEEGYSVGTVYDIADTVGFQLGDTDITSKPWQYTDNNETSAMEALGEADAENINVAVHNAVQKIVAGMDTDYPSLIAESVEYIVRARLHLPKSTEVLSSISREGVDMEVLLKDINSVSRGILDSIGQAVDEDLKKAVTVTENIEEVIPEPVIHTDGPTNAPWDFFIPDNLNATQAELACVERMAVIDSMDDIDVRRESLRVFIDAINNYGRLPQDVANSFIGSAYNALSDSYTPVVDAGEQVLPELPEEANEKEIEIDFTMESSVSDWFAANYEDFENPFPLELTFSELLTGLQSDSLNINAIGADTEEVRNAVFEELSALSGVGRDELLGFYMNNSLVQNAEQERQADAEEVVSSVEYVFNNDLEKTWVDRFTTDYNNTLRETIDSNWKLTAEDFVAIAEVYNNNETLRADAAEFLRLNGFEPYADLLEENNYEGFIQRLAEDAQKAQESAKKAEEVLAERNESFQAETAEELPVRRLPEGFARELAKYNLPEPTFKVVETVGLEPAYAMEMASVALPFNKSEKMEATLHFSYNSREGGGPGGIGYYVSSDSAIKFGNFRGHGSYPWQNINIKTYDNIDDAIAAEVSDIISYMPEMEKALTRMGLYNAPVADNTVEEQTSVTMDNLFGEPAAEETPANDVSLDTSDIDDVTAGAEEVAESVPVQNEQAWSDVFDKLTVDELISLSDSSLYTNEMVENWGIELTMMDKLVTSVRTFEDLNAIGQVYQANEAARPKIAEILSHWNYGNYAKMLQDGEYDNYFDAVKNPAKDAPAAENVEGRESDVQTEQAARVREYKYYMNHRPIGPGTTPKDFSRFDENDNGGRFGAVYFDRPLTEQEISDFELTSTEVLTDTQENTVSADSNQETVVNTSEDTDNGTDSADTESGNTEENAEGQDNTDEITHVIESAMQEVKDVYSDSLVADTLRDANEFVVKVPLNDDGLGIVSDAHIYITYDAEKGQFTGIARFFADNFDLDFSTENIAEYDGPFDSVHALIEAKLKALQGKIQENLAQTDIEIEEATREKLQSIDLSALIETASKQVNDSAQETTLGGGTEVSETAGVAEAAIEDAEIIPDITDSSDSEGDDDGKESDSTEEAEEVAGVEYEDISLRPVDDSFTGIDLDSLDFDATMTNVSGKKAVFMRNLAAIQIVNHLEESGTRPNEQELKVLRAYSGFGGIPEGFDEHNSSWHNIYMLAKDEMTDAQYRAARASTLTAFYTPNEIVQSIYKGLKQYGFDGGNILDPSTGSGRFLSNMPEDMKNNSHCVGIELDSITALIAKYINSDSTIINKPFEKSNHPNGSFDLAISNIPFGNEVINDNRYEKGYLIHDYFINRMIDEVRPGGLVAVITSRGTMDKASSSARLELAQKAELVKGIRFPNSVFKDAGTDAVSDLLIFRKLENERTFADEQDYPTWVNTSVQYKHDNSLNKDFYYNVNAYFLAHPENVLGESGTKSTAFGYDLDVTPKTRHIEGGDRWAREPIPVTELLDEALSTLPKEYVKAENPLPVPVELPTLNTNVPYGYYLDKTDIIYLSPTGEKEKQKFTGKKKNRVISAINLRDAVRDMLADEMKDCDDETLANHQVKLNTLYDEHVKNYGPINNDKTLKRLFEDDSAYPLLLSLEIMEDDEVKAKSDVFVKRTVHAYKPPTHADTPEEALMISLSEKGGIDINYMSRLTGMTGEEVISKLEFVSIYEDIETNRFMTADEYLSGDVRERLEVAVDTLQEWQTELRNYASEKAVAGGYMEYKFNIELFKKDFKNLKYMDDFVDYLDTEHRNIIFKSENKGFLVHVINNAGWHDSERMFHSYIKDNPDEAVTFDSPSFFVSLLPSIKSPRSFINYPFNGVKVLKKIFDTCGFNKYMQISPKDYQFVTEIVAKYANGEHPEVIDTENLREEYQNFNERFENRIEEILASDDEYIVATQNDISRLKKNIDALEKVQPKDLTADEINIHLGASWIPASDIRQFVIDVFDTATNPDVEFAPLTGDWKINNKKINNINIDEVYGFEGVNALTLLEKCLNHRTMEIKKTVVINGKEKKVTDRKKTVLAAQKMQNIREAFSNWIFTDKERTDRLVSYYNRHFNNIVPRKYDGSNLKFPGMNPEIKLYPHQKDAIAHSLYGGNTLFAHVVGAGKTFEMQASAMESKRIGLCKKPMFIMPKHLTEQFGAEFLRLYPNAKILVSTPNDSGAENRRKFCAKIAAQDWDAIIMSYEQFEKIPLSIERTKSYAQRQIDELVAGINELKLKNKKSSLTVKQAEEQKKRLESRLNKRLETYTKKQDITIFFEQLGVDRLYVDESHNFKNLGFFTKMSGVNSNFVQKTEDLMAKIDYLNEITNERGVVFASGTPISNSFAEFFTLQKYLKPSRLKKQNMSYFDMWASTFGQEVTQLELSADGKSYSPKTRFAKFDNIPELMSMFYEFADVKTSDMLNLDVPECEVVMEKAATSPIQKDMVNKLVKRAELIKSSQPIVVNKEAHDEDSDKGLDNMLVVINDGRNVALDPRIINDELADFADSKVNRCISNVIKIYNESADIKGTQIVFCDLSTPKKEKEEKDKFTVYRDIVDKLIAQGIPKEEIAVIHDYEKPEQKQALFNQVNKGSVRILLGSSDKLGIGTNVQKRLVATHDLDCPWKPSQIEQRRGRIVRHGNMNKKVKIYRYITEGTFDAFMWQTNERKQGFISQVMTSKNPSRSITDMDSTQIEFAEFKAACTDNPLFKEQMELSQEVEVLSVERVQHMELQARLKPRLEVELPSNISMYEKRIENINEDLKTLKEHEADKTFKVGNREFKMEDAGKAFAAIIMAYRDGKIDTRKTLYGEYKGLKLEIALVSDLSMRSTYEVTIRGESHISFPIGSTTEVENGKRLADTATYYENNLRDNKILLENNKKELEDCKKQIGIPFAKEEEYQKKALRLAEVNAIVAEQEAMMELEVETEKRKNQIADIDLYEGNKSHFIAYLKAANSIYESHDGQLPVNFDELIAERMQNHFSKKEIAEAIYSLSPNCPDKEKTEEKYNPKKENAASR